MSLPKKDFRGTKATVEKGRKYGKKETGVD